MAETIRTKADVRVLPKANFPSVICFCLDVEISSAVFEQFIQHGSWLVQKSLLSMSPDLDAHQTFMRRSVDALSINNATKDITK